MFCYSRTLVSGVQCEVGKLFVQLYVGPCHLLSADIVVAIAVAIENPATVMCEVLFVFCRPMVC